MFCIMLLFSLRGAQMFVLAFFLILLFLYAPPEYVCESLSLYITIYATKLCNEFEFCSH